MRLLVGGLVALAWGQACRAQDLPVVTKTVYKSCTTKTSYHFPSLGWVSSDGSSVPYTFASNGLPRPSSMPELQTEYPTGTTTNGFTSFIAPYPSGVLPSPTQSTDTACITASARQVSCPASNGTLYFPPGSCAGISSNSTSFVLFCGFNFEGVSLSPLNNIPSEEACIAECTNDSDCVAVGYNIVDRVCDKRSAIVLASAARVPDVIFAIERRYYVSLQLEQPPETVPPVMVSTNALPAYSPGPGTNSPPYPSATITSAPAVSPSFPASLAPGTYITGGTGSSTVIGGTTQTYTSQGLSSTAVTGGLTTTYTAGGITTTIPGAVSSPTSTAVADAVIGACPAYQGRVYPVPGSDEAAAYLVACGSTYNGTIIGSAPLLKRAIGEGCVTQCEAISNCIAVTYTSGQCTFYSEVNGQIESNDPSFSAIKIDANANPAEDGEAEPSASTAEGGETTTFVSSIESVSTSLSEVPLSTMTSTLPASSFTVTITTTAFGQTSTVLSVSTQPGSITTVVLPASTATLLITTSIPVTFTTIPPASTVVSTQREVSTQLVTLTEPGSSYSFTTTVISEVPGSTIVSTNLVTTTVGSVTVTSTERVTSTVADLTFTSVQVLTTTAPGSTVVSTEQVTITQPASSFEVTRTVTSLIPGSTVVSTNLLTTTIGSGVTVTSTEQITSTLPASTVTSFQILTTTFVPPPQFETRTIISTQSAQVVTSIVPGSQIVSTRTTTLPASTLTVSYVTTFRETSTILATTSAAGQTITQSITTVLPASTSTVFSVSTVSGSTVTTLVTRTEASVTVVTTRQATVISTVVSTAAASTVVSTRDRSTTIISTREVVTTAQGSTVFVISTTTSVIPASTATQTIRTTLPGSTVVVTNTAPGPTSTRAFTTTLSGQVITTTSISVRPASTATFTTSVISYISYGQIVCPANSGQEYTGADGSRYMVLCGQDYSGVSGEGSSANIYGINPVPARDLAACVNACTSQGTACAGVSWQGSSRRCDLKRTMFPTDASLAVSGYDSVVRISAGTDSAPPPAVTQLSNGDFNTGALPPWNNTFALDASVNVVNNAAVISFTGNQGFANVEQRLRAPVVAVSGLQYYMTLNIATSSTPLDGVSLGIILDTYGFGGITYPVNQAQTRVYISGRLDTDAVTVLALAPQSYSSDPGGTMTIDDISFVTYAQAVGVNPIPIPPVVSDGSYTFSDMDIVQYSMPDLQARQTFDITGSAQITLAAGTTCWLSINMFGDLGEQTVVYQQFTVSGTVAISARGYLFYLTDSFDLEFGCQGVSGSSLTVSSFFFRVF